MLMFKFLIFLALLLNVNADLTITVGSTTLTTVKCTTRLATTSAKTTIKTTTATTTLPPETVLIQSVSTPVTTITAPPLTVTSTVLVTKTVTTTDAAVTNTFSTTTTIIKDINVITTVLVVETVTSTVRTTKTTVVPPPQGFIPIFDSSREKNFPEQRPKRRNLLLDKRRPDGPLQYPSAVDCVKSVRVQFTKKIITVKPSVTSRVPGPIGIVQITLTRTSTSTVVPPKVSRTITFTTTSTDTTTILSFVVNTQKSPLTVTEVTTTTCYAACATNNLLGPRVNSGNYLTTFSIRDFRVTFNQVPGPTNAYECCVACQTGENCQFSAFSTPDGCVNVEDPLTCPKQPFTAGLFKEWTERQGSTSVYSNGPCGQMVSGGSSEL